jgi:hypothetical protein
VYMGMGSFLFCLIFWAVTKRLEPMLLGAGGTLMGISQGLDAYSKTIHPQPPPTPPVPDSSVGSGE